VYDRLGRQSNTTNAGGPETTVGETVVSSLLAVP
jgi:hypothetical protein